MADKKVSALSTITNLSQDDLFMVVDDPAGTPTSKKVTVGNLFGNVSVATSFSNTLIVSGVNVKDGINDRMQVANTTALLTSTYVSNTSFQSYVADTNFRLANTETQLSLANNALASKSPILNPIFRVGVSTPAIVVSNTQPNPATSNATTEGITAGRIFYSNTYLYIATDSNTIKRVALSTF